ncbi:MAG: Histidine ammonia-lyase [Candidatus Anoxychlamydiales bacterium]|nr:Histidine ammonia-lyase [Candidatus Anoxychlamydiales bacterium]NGX35496.1 Histidine ammonia-lyase [Candidatus Anoxychlamydiales bacterium]
MKIFIISLFLLSYLFANNSTFECSKSKKLNLSDFYELVYNDQTLTIGKDSLERLKETRAFIQHLLSNKIKVYGLSTGFADLRDYTVSSDNAGKLSENIIKSHDAGIGSNLSYDVVLGAMILRANSLAKGNSGFSEESLQTLLDMINAKIIPLIPSTGSLGASGDLAFLSRLGRAMQGDDVKVHFNGKIISAKEALETAKIKPFIPKAKEGLALTNGTSFMSSMLSIAYIKNLHEFENLLALQSLFYNSIGAVDAAFYDSIHTVRNQKGQKDIANIIKKFFVNSPFIDINDVQNDYCIRCIPQILGPKLEIMMSLFDIINNELNAITDNPLIFKNEEISSDVQSSRILDFNEDSWGVFSGGNFHGEYLATAADILAILNAKLAITMERQISYLLNPARNKNKLPIYLIHNKDQAGLLSGFMIVQYTANALTQKICQLATPSSTYNITSGNESEDIVSYGATSAQKLLMQIDLLHEMNVVYMTSVAQAYAITRDEYISKGNMISENLICEEIYDLIKNSYNINLPIDEDCAFDKLYEAGSLFLRSNKLREKIDFPLTSSFGLSNVRF